MAKRIKQEGAAIIVALFITALVAIAAMAMIDRLQIDVRRTELLHNAEKTHLYARGSIAWAMETLNKNWTQKKPNTLIDLTPIHSPIDTIEHAQIQSVIIDQEGLFNINNLSNQDYQESFIRLIRSVQPDISIESARHITNAIRDWIGMGTDHSAFESYYAKQQPPYRAPHRPMVSISELRLVQGITSELYFALIPHLTALPEATKININNADANVLMTLNQTLTKESAEAILSYRKKTPFVDIKRFAQFDVVKNNPIDENKISVLSSYFLVKTSVKVDQQETILYTLIHREIKNNKPVEVVLWQSKGTL